METQFQLFNVIFTFLVLFTVIKLANRSKAKNSTLKLPPGPRKLPLIGNLHNLAGSLPHHSLRDLANKYGPLLHLQLGEVSTIVVSSPEMAKEVLKNHDIIFAYRPPLLAVRIMTYGFNDIAFHPYDNYWRQLRKICVTELLSANRVKSFGLVRQEEVRQFIKSISSCEGLPINLTKRIFSMIHGIVSRTAFGQKCEDQEAFISVMGKNIELSSGFCLADLYPSVKFLEMISGLRLKSEKLHKEIDRILDKILKEHRQRKVVAETGNEEAKEDLVDVLLRAQENGDFEFPLTDKNIKAVILDIFGAGGETSSRTIDWAMAEMLKNPRVMKKAQAEVRQAFDQKKNVDEQDIHELKYMQAVIKETLRLHPTAPLLLPRECSESCKINEFDIPVKTRIIVNAWALGRDPMYWSEAETFHPERFLDSSIDYKGNYFQYIPFGGGRRICPGMTFALPAVELPLAQLLYHFDWKFPNGQKQEELDMSEIFGVSAKRKEDLVLIPIPYRPSFAN